MNANGGEEEETGVDIKGNHGDKSHDEDDEDDDGGGDGDDDCKKR